MSATARAIDPLSSHEAAAYVEHRGIRQAHEAVIAYLIAKHPGLTAAELAAKSGGALTSVQVSRRTADMARAELIWRGECRTCEQSRRLAVTWWPVPNDHINRAA